MSAHQNFVDLKNQVNPFDSIKIICLAIFTNLFAEFLTWMFIYRTKRYKQTKKEIDALNKKIEQNKENIKGTSKHIDKKVKQQENELKYKSFDMMKTKMISMFIIGLFTIFFISLFNGLFQGIVVAKLPFVPFKLISGMSHRGILSNDLTDRSFIFLYILCNISFRPIIQKLLGFAPPRNTNQMPGFWNPLEDSNFK